MAISTADIAKLRAQTGAGMLNCKKALDEAEGDFEKAVDILRKKGIAKAAKRAGKVAAEGAVTSYIHGLGKVGVLVEINSETDFVARNEEFQNLANDIAMHIAAAAPRYLTQDEVEQADIDRERDVYRAQLEAEGKPAEMIEKILEGKMGKFYQEFCLLNQKFVKDEDMTIEQLLVKKTGEIGEKITIRRFARFELGEGIEKEEKDFVSEVAEQLGE